MTRHSWLDDLYPEAMVEINPADAARLGLKFGDPVRVTSRRGTIVLRARVTVKAISGVVFIPFHFAEAAANLLTIDVVDPQAKIPEYKVCAVRVVPVLKKIYLIHLFIKNEAATDRYDLHYGIPRAG
jgi:predicted molibdopterin-dependent oxidoreductase YjgC